jgi:hypothetical protein
MSPILCISLSLTLVAGLLPAQRTWIVDRNNGPGTDFTDLPPAVAAAAPGDILRVRQAPGLWYIAPLVDKALSILGDPISRFDIVGAVEVRNVPANQAFTLANVRIGTLPVTPGGPLTWRGMNAHDNQGPLYFDNIEYGVDPSMVTSYTDPLGFLMERCALVTISHCTIYGSNQATTVRNSVLMATNSRFTGSYWYIPVAIKPDALFLQDSTVWLTDCQVTGTDGDMWQQATPGIAPCHSTFYIGGYSTIRGGFTYGGGPYAAIYIPINPLHNGCWTPASVMFLDPRSIALGVEPSMIANYGPVAALRWNLQSTSPRRIDTIQYSQPGSLTVLVAGSLMPTPLLGPLGPLALDPAQLFIFDVGFADAAGQHAVSIPIPASIAGPIALPMQGVELTAGQLSFTNAIVPGVF